MVWTGAHPPARTGGNWIQYRGSSTWHWATAGAVVGAAAGIAAAQNKKRIVIPKVRYGASPKLGDPCKDKPSGHTLVNWRVDDNTRPDIRLDCEGLNWLMHQQSQPETVQRIYDCITLILANAVITHLGPRSIEWKWNGGHVIVSEEDRILTAKPTANRNWDGCATLNF